MFLFDLLNLDEKQKEKLQKWHLGLPANYGEEETATMEGRVFQVVGYDTGIGPVYRVQTHIGGPLGGVVVYCNLSYDDDGNLID